MATPMKSKLVKNNFNRNLIINKRKFLYKNCYCDVKFQYQIHLIFKKVLV